MPPAPIPANERERLAALRSYEVMDTACEASYNALARLAGRLTGCPIAAVSLVDQDRQWFKAAHGLSLSETRREHAFCAHAIQGTDTMVVSDAILDPRFADNPLVTGEPHVRFYAGTPLVNAQGHALGALCVLDHIPRTFTEVDRDCLASLAHAVMTTLELRRLMRQMQMLAMSDALTGLANRSAFLIEIEKAIARQRRTGTAFGALCLDLDGFKGVNDTSGHATGDHVLQEVAHTLAIAVRREDMAARLGGDEFAVLLATGEDDSGHAAERIRAAIGEALAGRGWHVTASVGSALFRTPPADVETVLATIDRLMYEAKGAGKNRIAHRNA